MNTSYKAIMKEKVNNSLMVYKHTHIVLAREHYNPLGIIRSLGEAGIRTIVIIIRGDRKFVGSSKYVSKAIYVDNINEACTVLLMRYAKESLKPFLYITDDFFLEYFDKHYDIFKDNFILPNADSCGRISFFMNKDNINQLALKHGIRVPQSEVVRKGELPCNLDYPIITKAIASTSLDWKKDSFVCYSKAELIDAYSKIKGEIILLQEFIKRKGEFNIDGISVNHGKSVFLSMITKYKYLLPGRFSTYMDVYNVEDDILCKQLKSIIQEVRFEGIFDGEFMIGTDDQIYFLEINFRPNAFNYASTCAGMNDPFLWAQGMLESNISKDHYKKIPKGFHAMVEGTDFKDRVGTKKISLLKWIIEFFRCDCHFYFNMHDIKPFINWLILR